MNLKPFAYEVESDRIGYYNNIPDKYDGEVRWEEEMMVVWQVFSIIEQVSICPHHDLY